MVMGMGGLRVLDASIIWLPLGFIATVYVLAEKAADGMMSCKGVVVVCVSFWF
jgi:hypothetical protein